MAVLLRYNEADRWTVGDLTRHTNIKMDILSQVLQILLKSKLLVTQDETVDENNMDDNTMVIFFAGPNSVILVKIAFLEKKHWTIMLYDFRSKIKVLSNNSNHNLKVF